MRHTFANRLLSFTLAVIFILLPSVVSYAQSGFLVTDISSARTYALGEAAMADYYDVTSMTLNPAILIENNSPRTVVLSGRQGWNSNVASEYLKVPLFQNQQYAIALGMSLHNKNIQQLNYLDYLPPDYRIDIQRFKFSTASAVAVTSNLSLGVSGSLINSWNKTDQVWAGKFDAGLLYVPNNSISYGIAVRNFGSDVRYENQAGSTMLQSRNRGKKLEVGATMTFPENSDRNLFTISLSNTKIFKEDQLKYKGGLEIKPVEKLALRTGYLNGPNESGFRFGVGFMSHSFRIDYAIAPGIREVMSDGHFLSISMSL